MNKDAAVRGTSTGHSRCILFLVILLLLITTVLLVLVVIMYLDEDGVEGETGGGAVHTTSTPTVGLLQKPNILYILADDLGHNDIGYNNPAVKTPTLDQLATQNGRILTQHYMQHTCTPSRHALLTGIYPFKSRMQHFILAVNHPQCSPTDLKFLPDKLKAADYTTHFLGKWHVGFCKLECTPLHRGFDTFHGLYQGSEDHWFHRSYAPLPEYYDWRDQNDIDLSVNGTHTTDIVTEKAIEILQTRDRSRPFFMLVSPTVPHSPLQAPQKYVDMYQHVPNKNRRIALAMISHLDASVEKIIDVLKATDQYGNTIFIFTSDNGGDVAAHHDNSPYRGGKGTLFEGGTRAAGFVHSPLLQDVGIHHGMFHVTDWHNTILSIAGIRAEDSLDGIDQTDMIMAGKPSRRSEFVYNIDMETPLFFGQAAIRVGDYKLIWGFEGQNDGWGLPGARTVWTYPPNLEELGVDPTDDTYPDLGDEMTSRPARPIDGQRFNQLIARRTFNVSDVHSGRVHLYHIPGDPEEKNNLAADPAFATRVMELKYRILALLDEQYVKPHVNVISNWIDKAVAATVNKTWAPGWCDELDLDMPSARD